MISANLLKRLTYAKYIFEQGKNSLNNKSPLFNSMSVLFFHDAVELFLSVIADQLSFKKPNEFKDYWKEAEKKEKPLPNYNELNALNKIRVDFKHHGITPSYDECIACEKALVSFFTEASKGILRLDFSTITVSDLIEDINIKEHIKAAEKFKDEEDYYQSICESAIAFNYAEKVAGDTWHSFFIGKSYWDTKKIVPPLSFSGYISTNNTLQNNFKNIEKSFKEVQSASEEFIRNINVLLLGVDIFKFKRFNLLTPRTYTDGKGVVHIDGGIVSIYHNKVNFNQKNALFCFHFVIDTAMKIEQNPLDLVNINSPKLIKIKNEGAAFFHFIGNELKEAGHVSGGKEYKVLSIGYYQIPKAGIFYGILHQEEKVTISADDVEVLE